MRNALTAVLTLASLLAAAQPGPMEKPLHVVVTPDHELIRNGVPQYMVISPGNDTLRTDKLRPAQGDSVLSFMVHASSADHPWSVKYLPGGAMMDLHLNHAPSLFGFTLRVPFTQGAFELDSRRLIKCLTDQAEDLQVRDARRPGWNLEHPFGAVDTLACHGGRLIYARGGRMHPEVRILDLMRFVKRVPRMPPTAAREASYPGGPANFDRFIRSHFSKPLIERTNARVKLSALVTIETDGSIHRVDLNGSAYPELDREFKRVVQLSSWWEPAALENIRNTIDPRTFRYVEQSQVIEFTVDPDSIWTEIPEAALTIMPKDPTHNDEISVTFHWIGGSCGRYEAYAKVQPAPTDGGLRDVFLYFGQLPGELCTDIKPQAFGFTMKPLPPGRYRFRQMPHPKLGGGWAPDPHAVRVVEVR
ncbi:MAG TPA: hypothetical protein PKE21_00075 [Flavobacteriales bacterium]|nr:hypothetical protein [Flavobacteriales bacterium]HMR25848.1 hypothetical protein [Flavobacteriales bacterium]